MKKGLLIICTLLTCAIKAQTVSTFENINLLSAGYWNGSDFMGGFSSGNATFNNVYDTAFGGSWSGWACSRLKDSITPGFNNQYSTMAGVGYAGSTQFAIGYINSFAGIYPRVKLTGAAQGKAVSGCMVTNNTYAYYDMKNGSSFSKKFGGAKGTDPDYFKLMATGYLNGAKVSKTAEFMLADFTAPDSTKDYIVKDWTWFDLTPLGNVDSIIFTLLSTDTGSFGMNTPAYFCLDNFTTTDAALSVSGLTEQQIMVYPNPAHDFIYTTVFGNDYNYQIYSLSGASVSRGTLSTGVIGLEGVPAGIYIIEISSAQGIIYQKIKYPLMRSTVLYILMFLSHELFAQFAPAAGYPGSDAIPADSSCFFNWANQCTVKRGYMNFLDSSLGIVTTGDALFGTGKALDNPTVSLGDGGEAILEFPEPIINGPGPDFAVFENAFIDSFLELATVSVSSDGISYYTFPAVCHTDTSVQLGTFGLTDATKLYNLAGKYRSGYGVPFDLEELRGTPGLNVNNITHIKIKDVIGIINPVFGTRDNEGHLINDPWPTPFPSGGFDLDAVGVIWDQKHNGIDHDGFISFSAGPNPANESIYIQSYDPKSLFSLKDMQGKTIKELKTGMNEIQQLTPGFYFIATPQSTLKIVIQH